jgi:DNA-3-methyladenine glycosylase II
MRRRERALAARDPVMARLIAAAGPCMLSPRLERPPFETLARAIAHQQLNGTAAERILGRFTALYAPAAFPEPAALATTADEPLRACGFSFAKIRALVTWQTRSGGGWSRHARTAPAGGPCDRRAHHGAASVLDRRDAADFQLGRPDVLPVDDFGVCNGFRLAYGLRAHAHAARAGRIRRALGTARSLATWYPGARSISRASKLPRRAAPRETRIAARAGGEAASPASRRPRRAMARIGGRSGEWLSAAPG